MCVALCKYGNLGVIMFETFLILGSIYFFAQIVINITCLFKKPIEIQQPDYTSLIMSILPAIVALKERKEDK